MNIYLGDMNLEQIQNRMGITFPDDLVEYLLPKQQHIADTKRLTDDEWHCFDIPFVFVCGSRDLAQKIYDVLKVQSANIKVSLELAIR